MTKQISWITVQMDRAPNFGGGTINADLPDTDYYRHYYAGKIVREWSQVADMDKSDVAHDKITCNADPLLTVYIDRNNSASTVYYRYSDGDEQPAPYQTADMPGDDQRAAQMVNDWLS
jgi:hypothetical protein